MSYILAGIALVLGFAIGSLLVGRKSKIALAVAEQRLADLSPQLEAEKTQTQSLRDSLAQSEQNLAALRVQFSAAQQNLVEQKNLLQTAQEQLRHAFASASAEALARNNEAFLQLAKERFATISTEAAGSLDQRKEQIDAMLKPLNELMNQYQLRVGEIEKARVESYSMLREQLGTLAEAQRTLNSQTSQLVTALSRPTVRGQWGEISLRRLVELAGLTNRCDFVEQASVHTEEGRLRPDVVVKLPGNRDIVIDCKATLEAFLDAAASPDEDTRRSLLQRHAQHVRSRARDLGGKSYWSQFSQSPEYVIMFLPGEAFLYAAVEHDPNLIDDCIRNHVLIATPTTLIALLKTIEFGWRQETITENAEQIRDLGKELHERIGTVLTHIAKLGSNLSSAVGAYNSVLGSIDTRVTSTARKLSEMGARGSKELTEPERIEVTVRELPALTSDSTT
jgi:DNA recombination protein RmuC